MPELTLSPLSETMNLATLDNGQNPEGQNSGSSQEPAPDPGNEGKKLTVLSMCKI
jgi:hypothetical protein